MSDLDSVPADRAEMLHLYKIAVESVERASDRRQAANSFYFTIVSALLAGYFASYADAAIPALARTLTCLFGLGVGAAWLSSILGFRAHNSIKFRVIDEMEQTLAFRFFRTENRYFNERRFKWRFTTVELAFPLATLSVFGALLLAR